MRKALACLVVGALALTACMGQPQRRGPPTKVIDAVLRGVPGVAQPSRIVAIEVALGQLASELTPTAALLNYAAATAQVQEASGLTPVQQWIGQAPPPATAIKWNTRAVAISCDGALAASTAEVETPAYASAAYDRVSTWSVGAKAEFETIAIGATWLSSDNGLVAGGDYEAWTAGITKTYRGFLFGGEYGQAEDGNTGLDGDVWKLGISHSVTKHAKMTLGYAENSLKLSPNSAFGASGRKNSPEGIVIEITLSR